MYGESDGGVEETTGIRRDSWEGGRKMAGTVGERGRLREDGKGRRETQDTSGYFTLEPVCVDLPRN